MTTAMQKNAPWIHRTVDKDKLRVRERYWHCTNDDQPLQQCLPCLIPDGLVWRKYLKLIILLIEPCKMYQFVLLESSAELMDYRNSSLVRESTATQERTRLKKLVRGKQIRAFCDFSLREEECDEWDILRYTDMTTEDRCKNGILRASKLLQSICTIVIIIVDDSQIEEMKSESSEVEIMSMEELLRFFLDQNVVDNILFGKLVQSMQQCDSEYCRRNNPTNDDDKQIITSYLSEESIEQGLRDGSLLKGRLEVTKQNAREGFVSTQKERYFLNQESYHFNRAIHHDLVIIQPLPETQWECPLGRRRLVHPEEEEGEVTDRTLVGPVVPTARVVSVTEISRRIYVATLVDSPADDDKAVLVVPMDPRIPRIRIRTSGWQRFVNQRLLVEIDDWDIDSTYPNGHCKKIIGAIGDLETEISCLLHEHEIRLETFSVAAKACLPEMGVQWSVTPEDVRLRRDLRTSRRIFSVDPPGCQDIDDAMHAELLPNGDIEVGVHIADVTHFVAHNSALDKEAQVRGTTFYLVDRRFDMLPSLLSGNLCSLHCNLDRLAVSVIWTMSPDFQIVKSVWYGRTVIHNCQAMTYDQAHNILHDLPPDEPLKTRGVPPLTAGATVDLKLVPALKQDLGILTQLARKLRRDREEIGGAVDLSSGDFGSELKFPLDDEGNPIQVKNKVDLEIHHTIAEMMIMANQSVAEKIYDAFPESSLVRIHQSASADRFDDLQSALKAGGIEFDGSSNMALARSLKQAQLEGKNAAIVNSLWQSLATRAMSEAQYICASDQKMGNDLTHYGLGIDKYTHFTSPIRRYADIVVHKQLLAALVAQKKRKELRPPPGFPYQQGLPRLPSSAAISIERGEGLKFGDHLNASDDHRDVPINGMADLGISSKANYESPTGLAIAQESKRELYNSAEVSSICDILNKQNRMAKLSSVECQRLFLSLYFRDHLEMVSAVITDIRLNGFLVYVPRFQLKGPVFLSDVKGNIQIDPTLFGMPRNTGLDPSPGFTSSGVHRHIQNAKCVMHSNDNDDKRWLEVIVPDAPLTLKFRVLDVVIVQISCDPNDGKARVAPLRFHLVAKTESPKRLPKPFINSLALIDSSHNNGKSSKGEMISDHHEAPDTLYAILSTMKAMPHLENTSLRFNSGKDSTTMRKPKKVAGRRIFGQFINPETRAAQQEAAVTAASESATERRAMVHLTVERRAEYDRQQNIERSVTARTQKLAAFKRSAKRGN